MKKLAFTIGQPVLVDLNDQAVANYDGDKRLVKRDSEWNVGYKKYANQPEMGVITGMKQFWEGEYTSGHPGGGSYFGDPYEYEEAYTSQDNEVVVWCVRLGYRNKELYFFEEDIKPNGEIHQFFKQHLCFPMNLIKKIPYFWNGGYTKEYREQMSRESKTWPRDSKGRFCK